MSLAERWKFIDKLEMADFCGLDIDDKPGHYGTPCTEENCPKNYKWEFFHTHCKYRNRDYGPP